MNTNASRPKALARLFDAGLDSIRVSLNSAREEYYMRYYKPKDYSFKDVVKSIDMAKGRGVFVSINYLTMPGFTDGEGEYAALKKFLQGHRIDMIQWRNLNFDPVRYFRRLNKGNIPLGNEKTIGIKEMVDSIRKEFPKLKTGYFNPPTNF